MMRATMTKASGTVMALLTISFSSFVAIGVVAVPRGTSRDHEHSDRYHPYYHKHDEVAMRHGRSKSVRLVSSLKKEGIRDDVRSVHQSRRSKAAAKTKMEKKTRRNGGINLADSLELIDMSTAAQRRLEHVDEKIDPVDAMDTLGYFNLSSLFATHNFGSGTSYSSQDDRLIDKQIDQDDWIIDGMFDDRDDNQGAPNDTGSAWSNQEDWRIDGMYENNNVNDNYHQTIANADDFEIASTNQDDFWIDGMLDDDDDFHATTNVTLFDNTMNDSPLDTNTAPIQKVASPTAVKTSEFEDELSTDLHDQLLIPTSTNTSSNPSTKGFVLLEDETTQTPYIQSTNNSLTPTPTVKFTTKPTPTPTSTLFRRGIPSSQPVEISPEPSLGSKSPVFNGNEMNGGATLLISRNPRHDGWGRGSLEKDDDLDDQDFFSMPHATHILEESSVDKNFLSMPYLINTHEESLVENFMSMSPQYHPRHNKDDDTVKESFFSVPYLLSEQPKRDDWMSMPPPPLEDHNDDGKSVTDESFFSMPHLLPEEPVADEWMSMSTLLPSQDNNNDDDDNQNYANHAMGERFLSMPHIILEKPIRDGWMSMSAMPPTGTHASEENDDNTMDNRWFSMPYHLNVKEPVEDIWMSMSSLPPDHNDDVEERFFSMPQVLAEHDMADGLMSMSASAPPGIHCSPPTNVPRPITKSEQGNDDDEDVFKMLGFSMAPATLPSFEGHSSPVTANEPLPVPSRRPSVVPAGGHDTFDDDEKNLTDASVSVPLT